MSLFNIPALLLVWLLTAPGGCTVGAGFYDSVFPHIRVTMRNELKHPVLYMCSLDNGSYLRALWPNEQVGWRFREILAPVHWCYLFQDEEKQGFFWAFELSEDCKHCSWRITEDGPGLRQGEGQQPMWRNMNLHTRKAL